MRYKYKKIKSFLFELQMDWVLHNDNSMLKGFHGIYELLLFFKCYLAAPRPTLRPLLRGQPHSPNVNHYFLHIRPEVHREPLSEVGSLSPVERLVGFELWTFRFWYKALTHLFQLDVLFLMQHISFLLQCRCENCPQTFILF